MSVALKMFLTDGAAKVLPMEWISALEMDLSGFGLLTRLQWSGPIQWFRHQWFLKGFLDCSKPVLENRSQNRTVVKISYFLVNTQFSSFLIIIKVHFRDTRRVFRLTPYKIDIRKTSLIRLTLK